jgi:hypothetical protein
MENLYVNSNPELIYYPIVNFNVDTGICEISGESYMEETYVFYEPVINWLREYVNLNKPLVLNIKLTYFNTSSSRFILEMLDVLKKYRDAKGDTKINWYYRAEDPDMLNEIHDVSHETGIEINVIKMK